MTGSKLRLQIEYTYTLFSLLAAVISISIVKININFAYYFFVMTRTFSDSEQQTSKLSHSLRTAKLLTYVTLSAPLLICFLYVNELAYSLVAAYISVEAWQLVRLIFVAVYAVVRIATFRDEVQF